MTPRFDRFTRFLIVSAWAAAALLLIDQAARGVASIISAL